MYARRASCATRSVASRARGDDYVGRNPLRTPPRRLLDDRESLGGALSPAEFAGPRECASPLFGLKGRVGKEANESVSHAGRIDRIDEDAGIAGDVRWSSDPGDHHRKAARH